MDKELKSEDRNREIMIEPANLLEALGIDKYAIDRAGHKVYLDRTGLGAVAAKFGKRLYPSVTSILVVGWEWESSE